MPKTKNKKAPQEVPQTPQENKDDNIIRHPISISDTGLKYYNFQIGPYVRVTEDKRTKTKVANFSFEFPDGTRGVLIVCKVKDEAWEPSKDIKEIQINFQ